MNVNGSAPGSPVCPTHTQAVPPTPVVSCLIQAHQLSSSCVVIVWEALNLNRYRLPARSCVSFGVVIVWEALSICLQVLAPGPQLREGRPRVPILGGPQRQHHPAVTGVPLEGAPVPAGGGDGNLRTRWVVGWRPGGNQSNHWSYSRCDVCLCQPKVFKYLEVCYSRTRRRTRWVR